MYFRGRSKPAPVSVGEELDVTIEAVGEKGDGVAKKDGFVLFVPNVQQGERVRIKVTKVLRKVGFAEKIGEAEAEGQYDEPSDSFGDEQVSEERSDSESFGEEPDESQTDEYETEELEQESEDAESSEEPEIEDSEKPAE